MGDLTVEMGKAKNHTVLGKSKTIIATPNSKLSHHSRVKILEEQALESSPTGTAGVFPTLTRLTEFTSLPSGSGGRPCQCSRSTW